MVYTKPWVVDLILDLAGYVADRDLVAARAAEPAAGAGAFVRPMVRRLYGIDRQAITTPTVIGIGSGAS